MKRVTISGQIMPEHWFGENEVTEKDVTDQLKDIQLGEETEIVISSPGGDVFTAIAIFNHIREFAKTHSCTVIMQGIVGSAASYIAIAAKAGNPETKIKAYDNSIFFIHNAQAFAYGDYHEMERMAGLTKSISDLICDSAYAKVSTDSVKEIHAAMDAETYYFGEEIKQHGYADEIDGTIETNGIENATKDRLVAEAKSYYHNCMNHLQKWQNENEKNGKIAAKLSDAFAAQIIATKSNPAVSNAPEKTEDSTMDAAELKAKNPEVYNQIFAAGVNDERSRVTAHLKMAADSGDVSAAVDFIQNGTAVQANEVTAKYHEVFCKTKLAEARLEDNAQPVVTPAKDATDERDETIKAYKKAMLGGK